MKNILVLLSLLISVAANAFELNFKADQWELKSFPYVPADNTVTGVFGESVSNGELEAIWTYDNQSKQWQTWPQTDNPTIGSIEQLHSGQGYWIKTKEQFQLVIETGGTSSEGLFLYPGWNLIGMTGESAIPHEQALAGVPFLELWKYDAEQNGFFAVQKSGGSQIILKEQFLTMEPGQGYWIYVTEQTQLVPELATLLPPDIDVEPLLPLAEYGKEALWSELTPGDVDWDGDGFFDFPNTQQTVAFGDFLNRQRIAIKNEGNGVLTWDVYMDPPVKWMLFEAFDEEGNPVLTNEANGSVSDVNGELVMVVNRVGLAPGSNYKTELVLSANGSVAEKRIKVAMAVADVVGDYEVTVRLDKVDGKDADLHNPKYFMSFANDGHGVKAFLDEERSLLIPETTYLSGNYVNNPQNNFQVLGQLYLPKGHEHNPFEHDIRREFTFIGQRSDGRDGLSPLDLKGTYTESVFGIYDKPVSLQGEFIASRLSPIAKAQDNTQSQVIAGNIVAQSENDGISEFNYEFKERYSITEVKALLDIQHSEPEKLKLELIGPQQDGTRTKLVLHEFQTRTLSDANFAEFDKPVDSLGALKGQIAMGTWTLKITNTSDSVGQLKSWQMDINGANVYQVTGSLPGKAGIRIQLSGCGVIQTVVTDENGQFTFDGLVPCDYNLSVLQEGYEITSTQIRVLGCTAVLPNECQSLVEYQFALTAEQLAQLAPRLAVKAGEKKLIINPLQAYLPVPADNSINLQVTDISDYGEGASITQRDWKLYKKMEGDDAVIATRTDGNGENPTFARAMYLASEAGIYYMQLTTSFNDSDGQAHSLIVVSPEAVFNNIGIGQVHFGLYSNFAASGSAGGKFMDSATFDINRPPYETNSGLEDSDSFKASISEATETNEVNDTQQNPVDSTQFNFIPSGFNEPAGNLRAHHRIYTSTGQLIFSPPVYGGNFRMDIGVQSAETNTEVAQ